MALLSMRARRKITDVGLVVSVCTIAIVLQFSVLNRFPVHDVFCNLPLVLVIIWGAVTGSPLPPITPDELRVSTLGQIFLRQAASGSITGALVGAFVAALYASALPIYPYYFPVIGWVSGYFSLRNINQRNLLCIPLVLVLTGLAETLMALQLIILGEPQVIDHLIHIVVPEAILNAMIAPFIYFPMRRWFDIVESSAVPLQVD